MTSPTCQQKNFSCVLFKVKANRVSYVSGGRSFCLSLILALGGVHAADMYVSTQGIDSNAGTSAQPFRTITHACSLAAPGDRIIVMPGIYVDYSSGWGIHLSASGTACSPIVLKSEIQGGAIIDGQNATDRNLGIYLDGSYNTVDGFEIRNNPNGGISILGIGNQILNNEIHHNGNLANPNPNGENGVYSAPVSSGNVYSGNYIHDNGRQGGNLDHGFYLCGKDELVINNVVVGNAASGMQVAGYMTVSDLRVYNNVLAWNGTDGIVLWQALNGVDIKNNIIFQNGQFGLGSWDAHGSGVIVDHNLSSGNGYGDFDSTAGGSDYSYTLGATILASPLLAELSLAGFDAHLSAGSPAIHAGLNLSSAFTTDKDGVARPASGPWDLGAYRFIPSQGIVLSSPTNNAIVSGSLVSVSAIITGLPRISIVQFEMDGQNLGSRLLLAPYQVVWDTTTVSDGAHSLAAVGSNLLGDETISPSVSVLVSNMVPQADVLSQTFGSTSGALSGPFYVTNSAIVQSAYTSLSSGGRASYCFMVPIDGDYLISSLVNAPETNANSFFINVDAEPNDPTMIWDIPVTPGTASRTVDWRGNGTAEADQFVPKLFNLATGKHQLIVRGRGPNCQLGDITVELATTLRAVESDGMIELLWPNALRGYELESKPSLTGVWTLVTNAPTIIGTAYVVKEPALMESKIYRLRRIYGPRRQ
jgi:hypothetical protein